MSLHDEMKAALDEWCGERAEVSADAEETFRAILARHPEPAVSKPTAEQVLTIAEGLRKRFAVSNGTQVWVEFQGSAEALADEIADIFTQLQVQAPVGEGLENEGYPTVMDMVRDTVSDGEREDVRAIVKPLLRNWNAGDFEVEHLSKDIAKAILAAGYRKPTLPSVEDIRAWALNEFGVSNGTQVWIEFQGDPDKFATAVLDLLKRGA